MAHVSMRGSGGVQVGRNMRRWWLRGGQFLERSGVPIMDTLSQVCGGRRERGPLLLQRPLFAGCNGFAVHDQVRHPMTPENDPTSSPHLFRHSRPPIAASVILTNSRELPICLAVEERQITDPRRGRRVSRAHICTLHRQGSKPRLYGCSVRRYHDLIPGRLH